MGKEKRVRNKAPKVVRSIMPTMVRRATKLVIEEKRPNENSEMAQLPPYIALSKLSLYKGDRHSLEKLLGRLSLGRVIAHYHFNEPVGAFIHDSIQLVIRCCLAQDESDRMFMNQPDIKEVGQALHMIDDMQHKLNHDDYLVSFYRYTQFELQTDGRSYQDRNLVPWEKFKQDQGWL